MGMGQSKRAAPIQLLRKTIETLSRHSGIMEATDGWVPNQKILFLHPQPPEIADVVDLPSFDRERATWHGNRVLSRRLVDGRCRTSNLDRIWCKDRFNLTGATTHTVRSSDLRALRRPVRQDHLSCSVSAVLLDLSRDFPLSEAVRAGNGCDDCRVLLPAGRHDGHPDRRGVGTVIVERHHISGQAGIPHVAKLRDLRRRWRGVDDGTSA